MNLYDTFDRKVKLFKPIDKTEVKVYTCGPTVYDYTHIGHWFTYVRAELLIRVLRLNGFKPNWIINITDVGHLVSDADEGEDKLEKGARREGKTAWQIADFYTTDFLHGWDELDLKKPAKFVKATDHIKQQTELIQKLEAKGFTYVIDDGVYFDTSKFKDYGLLARLDIGNLKAGARVYSNPQKRNMTDFALWKFSPLNQKRDMEWDSPWGKGFPGWHIECSAMSMHYLGYTLDIHTGGIDHIPVHHNNEIAQSEAATGQKFVNYWLHSNHVLVDGAKISKSLGNGIRLADLQKRGVGYDAFKILVLESHYRSQSQFSWETLQAAINRLNGYQAMADLRFQPARGGVIDEELLEKAKKDITAALNDDLNTPNALARLNELASKAAEGIGPNSIKDFKQFIEWLDDTFGLHLSTSQDITRQQKQLISERMSAKAEKDWAKADKVRQQLEEQGVGLRDIDQATFWFRQP